MIKDKKSILIGTEGLPRLFEEFPAHKPSHILSSLNMRVFTADWMPNDQYVMTDEATAQMLLTYARIVGGEKALELVNQLSTMKPGGEDERGGQTGADHQESAGVDREDCD